MTTTVLQPDTLRQPHQTQLLKLDLLDPPSNPLNPLDWALVDRIAGGYERGDPIPAILVFPVDDGRYEILFGQHRFHGRRRAGKTDIEARILPERPAPLDALALQFKENHDHRELTGMERATAFFRAKQLGKLSNKAISVLFGISEPTVSRDLRTDKNLHPALKELQVRMELCPKEAWALARLPLDTQVPFYEQHKGMKAESMAEAVSDKLAELGNGKPKDRPVSGVTPGGVRYTLPVKDLKQTLADLKRLVAGLQWVIDKKLPPKDLEFYFRSNP